MGDRKHTKTREHEFNSELDMFASPKILQPWESAYIHKTQYFKVGDGVNTLANLFYNGFGNCTSLAQIIQNGSAALTPGHIGLYSHTTAQRAQGTYTMTLFGWNSTTGKLDILPAGLSGATSGNWLTGATS
jgi:hypothetical protein